MFADRTQAGQRLGEALRGVVAGTIVVLGIPRGGVITAVPVANALGARLDVVVPRKLGAPFNPELAIGAVAPGVRVLDDRLIARLGVAGEFIDEEAAREEGEIARRTTLYRDGREPPDLSEATVVVVDDGVATGATGIAALRWSRGQGAAAVVFAAPVGPRATAARLADECDDVVILETPASFYAVGEWYERFDQVEDHEVLEALASAYES